MEAFMNNKFLSNTVNFIFAFAWLVFFSTFAYEIFNSFFGRAAYYIHNPASIIRHRLIYVAITASYGLVFGIFYRDFFLKQTTLVKRTIWLVISLIMFAACWYYIHYFLKFYWYAAE